MLEFAYARLSPSLLGGRMPYAAEHVRRLAADGVVAVVNLCQDREYWDGERGEVEAAYRGARITEHRLAVIDGGTVPDRVLDAALAVTSSGDQVYVHCRGGRERSAAVATALLAVDLGLPADAALARAQRSWPVFDPLPWQHAKVRDWVDRRRAHADRSRV